MNNFDRLKQEGQQGAAFRMLRRHGLSAAQAWEILREEEPLTEIELKLMFEERWSLHQVRQTLRDAVTLKLVTCSSEHLARLDAYLDKHGLFIQREEAQANK